jgi:hypothetical protein
MARLKVKASELRDVSVNFVSLVKRGANRIPFRIVKSDDGGTAVLDLGSFFLRKADAEEATRQATRKSDDLVKAAMDMLTKAGYEVKRKSEPADDGVGKDETANPADGKDAGGVRSDGDSAGGVQLANPADGKDAGGQRSDGTELPAVMNERYSVTKNDDGTLTLTPKAAVAKGDAKNPADETVEDEVGKSDKKDVKKRPDAVEEANEAEADNGANAAEVKKAAKPAEGSPAEEAAETPAEEAAEQAAAAKKAATAKKADEPITKTDTPDMLAAIKSMFGTHSTELVAFVKKELDGLKTTMTEIEGRVQKTEESSAAVGQRLAALVPGQSAPDAEARFVKSDRNIPPLDTGYSQFAE